MFRYVSPPLEVEDEGVKKWEKCLIGYFLDSSIPFVVVKSIVMKIWRKFNLLDVVPLGDGFYVFKFSQLFGAKDVLEGGPWFIAGRYLVLRWWSAGLSLSKASLTSILIWVKLCGIPLEFWSEEGLSHIASAVGVPLFADAQTEQETRLRFARICIEVDASKPLTEEIFLQPNPKATDCAPSLIRIQFLYPWKPNGAQDAMFLVILLKLVPSSLSVLRYKPQPLDRISFMDHPLFSQGKIRLLLHLCLFGELQIGKENLEWKWRVSSLPLQVF